MLLEELHIMPEQTSPLMTAVSAVMAFVLSGIVPLLSYVFSYCVPFF